MPPPDRRTNTVTARTVRHYAPRPDAPDPPDLPMSRSSPPPLIKPTYRSPVRSVATRGLWRPGSGHRSTGSIANQDQRVPCSHNAPHRRPWIVRAPPSCSRGPPPSRHRRHPALPAFPRPARHRCSRRGPAEDQTRMTVHVADLVLVLLLPRPSSRTLRVALSRSEPSSGKPGSDAENVRRIWLFSMDIHSRIASRLRTLEPTRNFEKSIDLDFGLPSDPEDERLVRALLTARKSLIEGARVQRRKRGPSGDRPARQTPQPRDRGPYAAPDEPVAQVALEAVS